MMPHLPTGTVTFLFTDIEGSTQLWERYPEAMRGALVCHDKIAASIIHQHAGTLVKSRGEGDSLFAVFARATDAVSCACALQRANISEVLLEATPLKVRMALHTGEADRRDGDYYGAAVNRCARLRATAHGGQVLLSDVTHNLTCENLPPSVSLKSLGEHRLRDLGRPEHVYQLLHPDLPSEYPPLKSLDNPTLPNNLPQQVTSFIGREKEIAEVRTLITRTHLITLTGSGGCGKTRLALQVAAEVLENYPDGVWLVELASLINPDLIPQKIAQTLALKEQMGQSLCQTLVEAIKKRRLLLVLDNCEHVLVACAELADTLIRSCPNLKILATSRECLGIAGELTYRVPSLTLPDPNREATVESVGLYEAIQLFVERASFHLPIREAMNWCKRERCHIAEGLRATRNLWKLCFEHRHHNKGNEYLEHYIEFGSLQSELLHQQDVACSLEEFAQIAIGRNRLEQAVLPWGAADAARRAMNSPMPDAQRHTLNTHLAAARVGVGEQAFMSAWEGGQAMTLKQAVEYVCSEFDVSTT